MNLIMKEMCTRLLFVREGGNPMSNLISVSEHETSSCCGSDSSCRVGQHPHVYNPSDMVSQGVVSYCLQNIRKKVTFFARNGR